LKPRLFIAESQDFSPLALETLSAEFLVECADVCQSELANRINDVSCLWVRLRNYVDRSIIESSPNLKVIATNTTGLNHIDLEAAEERGVSIVSLRGEVEFLKSIRATAELTIALTLAVLRKLPAAHQHVIEGGWDRTPFKGRELYEKTVGIVGYGRLGAIVAGYFLAFGARVLVCDPKLSEKLIDGFEVCDLYSLLAASEIISLHANYFPGNERFFGNREFDAMRNGAVFVNTSRGELVDESALLNAIKKNRLSGVALDVISSEHLESHSLRQLRQHAVSGANIIMTPHIGGNTLESTVRTEEFLAQKLVELVSKKG